jgi:hypothetical protein
MPVPSPLAAPPIGGAGTLSPQALQLLRLAMQQHAQMARAAQPMPRTAPQSGLLGPLAAPGVGPLGYGGR